MPSRGIRRARGGRSASRLVIVAVSIACVGAGLLLAGQLAWFLRSSSVRGAAVVQRERRAISVAGHAARACQSLGPALHAPPAGGAPQGLLEIPVLGLVPPFLAGPADPGPNPALAPLPA